MKTCCGIVAAMAVMALASAAHAAVAVHGVLGLASPPAAPEPGTLGILATGAVLLLRRRRKDRGRG